MNWMLIISALMLFLYMAIGRQEFMNIYLRSAFIHTYSKHNEVINEEILEVEKGYKGRQSKHARLTSKLAAAKPIIRTDSTCVP